jgi:prepilin-type N-terminal cleavage/methylation domain-containing protein
MKIIKTKKGFTLVEVMMTVGILGVISIGIMNLMKDGMYMWHSGTVRIALMSEARLAMFAAKKMIQQCQGSTLKISRVDASNPANSYIEAVLNEAIFITTTRQRCGCDTTSETMTAGGTGAPVKIYQNGTQLLMTYPHIAPGTDISDADEVEANTSYITSVISNNVESLMFSYIDSRKANTVTIGLRLSKPFWAGKPPMSIFLKETVVVKRMHSAGYYHN